MSYGQKVEQGYLNFIKGLVTEINPLNAPEGTTSDELNMDLDTEGMVRIRRKPLAAQSSHTSTAISNGKLVLSSCWEDIDKLLVVVEVDGVSTVTLFIMVIDDGSDTIDYVFSLEVDKALYVRPSVTYARKRAIVILGGLPVVLQRESSGNFSVYNINILVRDFKLLPDGFRISERPITNPDVHKYNLLNAGWWQDRRLKDPTGVADPIANFFTKRGKYPSNADVSYLGDISNQDGDLVFDPMTYDNIDTGSTEAPRGHYVYPIRNITRSLKLIDKTNDGTGDTSIIIVQDGTDPGTGDPIDPVAPPEPWLPPEEGVCIPGQICNEIP
jgi:hypothetical protein